MLTNRPRKLKRVIIREEYVALTGDYKKAVILHELEYRQSKTYDLDGYLEEEGLRMAQQGSTANILPARGWFRRPAEQLSKDTLLNLSASNILTHIQFLIQRGWLQERKNPDELRDRTKQYRLDLCQLKTDLEMIGYQLEGWSLESLRGEEIRWEESAFSKTKNAISVLENGNHKTENPFSKTKNGFSKTEEHYMNTAYTHHKHPPTQGNGVGGSGQIGKQSGGKSIFERSQIEEYFTAVALTDKNIQSVAALARARWRDGSEDEKIRVYFEAQERKKLQEKRNENLPTPRSTEPCSVCRGTKVEVIPQKGARPCKHCVDEKGQPTGFQPAA